MSNEEFQELVLKKLSTLEEGQKEINSKLNQIETKIDGIEDRVKINSEFIDSVIDVAKKSR